MITFNMEIMSMEVKDGVPSLSGTPLYGVVQTIEWKYNATDSESGIVVEYFQKTELNIDEISNGEFTLYGNLNLDQVKSWIEDSLDETFIPTIENALTNRIDRQKRRSNTEKRTPPWV